MHLLEGYPSTITLRQTIDELLDTGIAENKMPAAIRQYIEAQKALAQVTQAKESTLARFRASWSPSSATATEKCAPSISASNIPCGSAAA